MGDTPGDAELNALVEESNDKFLAPCTFTERMTEVLEEVDPFLDAPGPEPSTSGTPAAEVFATEAPAETNASDDVPELITHDVPSAWSVETVAAEPLDAAAPATEMASEPAAAVAPEVANESVMPVHEDYMLTHEDFVSQEAPFAHAAMEEPMTEVAPRALAAAASANPQQPAAPALDQNAIAEAVERVMERMKGDLIEAITRELAAKIGK
jgi:hypothetical protein